MNDVSATSAVPVKAAFCIQHFISLSNPIFGKDYVFIRAFKWDLNSYKSTGNFGEETELEEALKKLHGAQFFTVAFPFPTRLHL